MFVGCVKQNQINKVVNCCGRPLSGIGSAVHRSAQLLVLADCTTQVI